MENFKSILFSIIGLAIFTAIGLWAFSTIESGSTHVNSQRQKDLETINEDLNKELIVLKTKVALLESEKEKENLTPEVQVEQETIKNPVTANPSTTVLKYQSLITEIQKLVNVNAYIKKGSQGTSVGTIQKFLNIYSGTSNKIDNDYGVSMISAVTKFQKDQGLTADGEAGVGTLRKMIDWLKKK